MVPVGDWDAFDGRYDADHVACRDPSAGHRAGPRHLHPVALGSAHRGRNLGCASVLELGLVGFDDDLLPDSALTALGWTSNSVTPAVHDAGPPGAHATHHSVAYGPGEVDGPGPARQLVDTVRRLGVASPADLWLNDWSETVGDYDVQFYGLALCEYRPGF